MTRLASIAILAPLCFVLPACDNGDDEPNCENLPGTVCTYVGSRDGVAGLTDEGLPARETELYLPQDLTFAPNGVAYILDWNNHRIRSVNAKGVVNTVVGTGYLGDAIAGPASTAALNHPTHISNAPDGSLIISAWHNSKIMKYEPDADTIAPICGNGMRSYMGDGGPAAMAILDLPVATAFAPDGSMYISDQANQRVRKVDAATDTIDTVVGDGTAGFLGDGGPGTMAQINLPLGQAAPPAGRIETDGAGNLYIADSANHRIRRMVPDGTITTYAGNGTPTFGGDGGAATSASLSRPSDVAIDAEGNLYIADTDNSCVRMVDPAGTITTAVGVCGSPGLGEENDGADETLINRPYGVTLDGDGNLYVADTHNQRIVVKWAD